MTKKKIAIIVQRYGKQINGGAESLAKMIAERLTDIYDVTVLTSRAVDYHTWKAVLPKGLSRENGVNVLRFNHPPKEEISSKKVHKLNRRDRGRLWYQKLYRFLGKPACWLKFFPLSEPKSFDPQTRWIEFQGPALRELPYYLKTNSRNYSAFIFITYLYYPTAVCMPDVGRKSIMIPTLHDELAAHIPIFEKIMRTPAKIFFLTEGEKRFAQKKFDISHIPSEVVSVGIDLPDQSQTETVRRLLPDRKFVLYAGRIETQKGCAIMLEYFMRFKSTGQSLLKLVLIGKNDMKELTHPDIFYAGFVSDKEKALYMSQAEALVMPSKYESLSLVLLESFAAKTPVLANGESEVLRDHIQESSGGWIYRNYNEFANALSQIEKGISNAERGMNGYKYVSTKYTWDRTIKIFDEAITAIEKANEN